MNKRKTPLKRDEPPPGLSVEEYLLLLSDPLLSPVMRRTLRHFLMTAVARHRGIR